MPKTKNDNSEFENFRQFAQKLISVPKSEIDRRETEYKKSRAKQKSRKS